jgi:hypothetical protein
MLDDDCRFGLVSMLATRATSPKKRNLAVFEQRLIRFRRWVDHLKNLEPAWRKATKPNQYTESVKFYASGQAFQSNKTEPTKNSRTKFLWTIRAATRLEMTHGNDL